MAFFKVDYEITLIYSSDLLFLLFHKFYCKPTYFFYRVVVKQPDFWVILGPSDNDSVDQLRRLTIKLFKQNQLKIA